MDQFQREDFVPGKQPSLILMDSDSPKQDRRPFNLSAIFVQ